nr:LD-carboxypeptidase [uncultured Niameybacter sp.]
MKLGSKVAIVCCSNAQLTSYEPKINELLKVLEGIGLEPVCSEFIYEKYSVFSGTGKERANALMNFYKDPEIHAIFDISGGDLGNEVLPYLDFEIIQKSNKAFWGYSDLTTIINAIYAKTGVSSILYQVRNLIYEDSTNQIENFKKTILDGTTDLFQFEYDFIQGKELEGIVVGGNIRCLLKLAGTPYWPNMQDKVLLLEAMGTNVAQATTYLCQLQQLGVFEQIRGIILGTFSKMEAEKSMPTIVDLVRQYIDPHMPIVKTQEIGHGTNSKAIIIGEKIQL